MPVMKTTEEILNELETWVSENHDHHYGCEDNDKCCPGASKPYVDSLQLIVQIRRLRNELETQAETP